ncbi:MAG: GatB/YqeY domain-containing protein [Actinomycetota bacterium]|nr:MAG: GatB/YqeY domain-containing protein [Actinomycetota bacterium]
MSDTRPAGLKAQLRSDLTEAIRSRDELRSATLRMVLAALTTEEVAGKTARELSDADVVTVLGREARKRREAATAYDEAARPELAARERAELGMIEGYLPAQLTDAELASIIEAAVATVRGTGQDGPGAMGAVMKLVQPKVAGRADGGRVAADVRRLLSS